jgi:hypothetical protein
VTGNSGIQNFDSNISGVQAAGPGAAANQHIQHGQPSAAPWPSPAAEALAAVVEALRADLGRLRAEQPQSLSAGDAADAEEAMTQIVAMAAAPEPDPRGLRRRIKTIIDAVGQATVLTTALTVLTAAVEKLIGLS